MQFPSLEFVKHMQEKLNADSAFKKASEFSDVKVLICFGDKRYWMKLYGGKIIDVMEYSPMAQPLGWDYMINGSLEAWEDLRSKKKVLGELVNYGRITIDGNLIQSNRMYEATYRIMQAVEK